MNADVDMTVDVNVYAVAYVDICVCMYVGMSMDA